VKDGGVAGGDGSGLGDNDVTMVEGVASVEIGVSEDGGGRGSDGSAADDDFGFPGLRNVRIDDGEMEVLPF